MSAWHRASVVWTCWDPGMGCEGTREAGWNFQGSLRLCSAQPALHIPKCGRENPRYTSTANSKHRECGEILFSLGENLFLHQVKYSKLIRDKIVVFLLD